MKITFSKVFVATAFLLLPALPAMAVGTPAGTNITNQASVSFVVETATLNQSSNPVTLKVAEVLNVTLQWQDASNILAKADETDKVATFLLTNTGNGSEGFTLTVDNGIAGDQFDPVLSGVYLDANNNNVYDAGQDTLYNAGANDPVLAADASIRLFVLNDIPTGVVDSNLGQSRLSAAAKTGIGTPGTAYPGAGDGGINAVVGTTGGAAGDVATLQIAAVDVAVVKSAVVADPFGGTEPMPTAVVTYSIAVTVSGSGTAQSVTVTDPIPANTTYVPGSIKLDGAALLDPVDGDAGEFDAGKITVRLGNLQNTARTVSFQVKID